MPALKRSLFDKAIVGRAARDAVRKLNPAHLLQNPVIFVTEVGALLTTIGLLLGGRGEAAGFTLQVSLWLWFTVLFANFAEAMAEGRGKAQADELRKTRTRTVANRVRADGSVESVPAERLRKGDLVVVSARETIPADGEVV
ncbi:MAG TPA: potassium-transporting ATPase subunit B, partial [Burkholderiales bacterium]|nr:potassium-transporting ATPase subunit B [Burkholderiales bacterium]